MNSIIRVVAVFVLLSGPAWPQVERVTAEVISYPEMVLYNGKIVTVDDPSFNLTPGTIIQAMAVRGGKIMALGDNSKIRNMSGPQTKVIDLKGRTVLPGFISTHDHLQEYAFGHEAVIRKVFGDDNELVARWVRGNTLDEITKNFEPALREAVEKAKPGEWIRFELFRGHDDQFRTPLTQLVRKDQPINKFLIDKLAPNNPVAVKSGTSMVLNQKALDLYTKLYPTKGIVDPEKGVGGTTLYRRTENDLVMADKLDSLARLYREEMSWWAGYGFTTFSTHIEGYQMLEGYRRLDRNHDMPLRLAWGYRDVPLSTDPLALIRLSTMIGSGSDFLWLIGMHASEGGTCTIEPASPEVKRKDRCTLAPGSRGAEDLYRIVKAGGRIATMHSGGDQDIDNLMEIIERASQEAGFTPDEIRAKRHAFDHCWLAPRPDQVDRIKRLGMMVGCQAMILDEPQGEAEQFIRDYGEKIANRITPQKLMLDGHIMNTFEVDRPLGHTDHNAFYFLHLSITRRNSRGTSIGLAQKIDRISALKTITTWGSYYVLREKSLGSLEAGKAADFSILDRDYLTIPEDDLPKIRVLMTVLDGKITHLFPEMATEIGVSPIGAQALDK